jgi:hypothetical protein
VAFILLTTVLWILALFHIWDHRRYERDLGAYLQDGGGDWRPVAPPAGARPGAALKRAFRIDTRADLWRYAGPVAIFAVILIGLRHWGLAAAYAGVVSVKWFALTTVTARETRRYAVYLAGRRVFESPLPD